MIDLTYQQIEKFNHTFGRDPEDALDFFVNMYDEIYNRVDNYEYAYSTIDDICQRYGELTDRVDTTFEAMPDEGQLELVDFVSSILPPIQGEAGYAEWLYSQCLHPQAGDDPNWCQGVVDFYTALVDEGLFNF